MLYYYDPSIRKEANILSSTTSKEPTQAPQSVTMMESFIYWLKLGFISFGGPAGQISMMHQELVEKRR
ncbi:MAG TPA: hypothetical protein EYH38_10050, partial [Leucothrix sp.]|nr:hypothetical protein [Leucothrix sp.]